VQFSLDHLVAVLGWGRPSPTTTYVSFMLVFVLCSMFNYFATGRGAKYCDWRVSVCLFVRSHISKTTHPDFSQYSVHYMLPVAMALFSSDGSAVQYVLPFSWMTSCFHKIKQMGRVRQVAALG